MRGSDHAQRLIRDSLVVDVTGANSPIHAFFNEPTNFEPWIAEYKGAGVSWVSMTAGWDGTHSAGEIIRSLAANRRYLLTRPDEYLFVETVADITRAKAQGKLAVNFNFQGSNPLQGDINLVEPLFKLGVGHMLLSYNDKNLAGGGCHDQDNPGLSHFGKRLVAEMNRVGMVVDATHTAHRTTMDIFEHATKPVIFSHSNAYAVHQHERNITDDQIKACAASRGAIGINGVGVFVGDNQDCSAKALFRHVDYIAELVGHQHIGLGLDFVAPMDLSVGRQFIAQLTATYGEDQYPAVDELKGASPRIIAELTQEMISHGYHDAHIAAILGGNWIRVFEENWGG
ncbi:MAG: membrane dipeptidase [Pseudonocardiales bacterium]|nr:membrane dipeptidase [Pseudonocardiales bacterium]